MYRISTLFFFLLLVNIQFASAQIVNIPDANFKTALLNHNPTIDTNNDGEIQVSEAQAALAISTFNQNISSIVGIEAFINLERLVCFSNPITSVDFSSNTQLEQISMSFTDITEIDISANLQLSFISLGYTSISEIDVTPHSDLEFLDVSGTNISEIDVSNNLNLLALSITNLTNINFDLSNNTLLESIEMRNIGIDSYDFSIFPNLKIVDIGFNNFTDVDFSNNAQLCALKSRNCPLLNSINIQNGNNAALAPSQSCSVSFTIGGIANASGIDAIFGNPNLDFICVDNIQFATDNFTLIPDQTQFVDDCSVLSIDSFSIQDVTLLANPVSEYLVFKSKQNIERVAVFSMTGKKLMTKTINNKDVNINVEDLAVGVYFVSLISTEGKSGVLKFIKK